MSLLDKIKSVLGMDSSGDSDASGRASDGGGVTVERERGDLSPDMLARCAHVVKIPTAFCLNLSVAAAITLYDRALCLGGFAERPVRPGGPHAERTHVWGAPRKRT